MYFRQTFYLFYGKNAKLFMWFNVSHTLDKSKKKAEGIFPLFITHDIV